MCYDLSFIEIKDVRSKSEKNIVRPSLHSTTSDGNEQLTCLRPQFDWFQLVEKKMSKLICLIVLTASVATGNELKEKMTAAGIFDDLKLSTAGTDIDPLVVKFDGKELVPGQQFSMDQVKICFQDTFK
jgi:hypothetical protein